MSVHDDLLDANRRYRAAASLPQTAPPARRLTIVTCMDARLDLLAGLGLALGDAHVIRNAGGVVTPDVLRSLTISQTALRTRSVAVIQHTTCGLLGFDDEDFRHKLAYETGRTPDWDVPGFTDIDQRVRESVAAIRECPWVPSRDDVRGYVYEVETAELREVKDLLS